MYVNNQHKVSISRTISSMTRTNEQRLNLQNKLAIPNRGIIQKIATLEYKDLDNTDLMPITGKIAFTEYKGRELKSSDFSGCIMAVFKFINLVSPKWVNILNLNGHQINPASSYIAHVYAMPIGDESDTKYEFAQLEKSGLIMIDAMYKPYDSDRDPDIVKQYAEEYQKRNTKDGMGPINRKYQFLTGSLVKNQEKWSAKTFYQDTNGPTTNVYATFDENRLQDETCYLKGFLGVVISNEKLQSLPASNKAAYKRGLKKCGEINPNVFLQNEFMSLSKGSQKVFFEGTKLYRKKNA